MVAFNVNNMLFDKIPLNNDNRAVDVVIFCTNEYSVHFCMFKIK